MADDHLPKPSLRSPAVAEKACVRLAFAAPAKPPNRTNRLKAWSNGVHLFKALASGFALCGFVCCRSIAIRVSAISILLSIPVFITCTFTAKAADRVQPITRSDDFVLFFKEAVRSSPDIEYFSASQRILRRSGPPNRPVDQSKPLPLPMFYEGSLSGNNFYLRRTTTNHAKGQGRITGRAGSNSYQINQNTHLQTSEPLNRNATNPIAGFSDASYGVIRQIFNLGIGNMEAGSLVWEGNEFRAIRSGSNLFYGRLEISNGLPSELLLSRERSGEPYKKCTYEYPVVLDALGGYPAKTVIWGVFAEGLRPYLELTLNELKTATETIDQASFVGSRFVTTNVKFTTVYSNNRAYAVQADGRMSLLERPASGVPVRGKRGGVLVVIGLVTACGLIALWTSMQKNKSKKYTNQK